MRLRAFFWVLVSLTLSGCDLFVDPDQQANRIFVEANTIWDEYQEITKSDPVRYEDRLELLNNVANRLDKIVADYPGSDLAVELVVEGQIGDIARSKLSADYLELAKRIDCKSSLRDCLLEKIYSDLPVNQKERNFLSFRFLPVGLVIAHIEKGEYDAAVKAANLISVESLKYMLLAKIGLYQSSSKAVEIAIEKIMAIEDSYRRNSALEMVSKDQLAAGLVKDAQATWALIKDDSYRDNAISIMALEMAESGNYDDARKVVEKIASESTRITTRVEVDYIETAEEGASNILSQVLKLKDSDFRNIALEKLALLMYQSDFISALEVAEEIDDADHRLKVIKEITKLNNIRQEAKHSLESSRVEEGFGLVLDLIGLAREQFSSGDLSVAMKTANRAFDAAMGIENMDTKTRMLGKIVKLKKELGDTQGATTSAKQAFNTALAMDNPVSRVTNLVAAAKYQAAAGDRKGVSYATLYALESMDAADVDASRRVGWLVDLYKITP